MISETAFVGAENLPEEMANALDRPWVFLGEVRSSVSMLDALCNCQRPVIKFVEERELVDFKVIIPVRLTGYDFITDDMLIVRVFFGTCSDCGRHHWARHGPPFTRVRQRVVQHA